MATKQPVTTLRPLAEMSPEERQHAEDRVLVPELDATHIRIGEHNVDLRPLNIKFAKQVKSIIDPVSLLVEKMNGSEAVLTAMGEIQDAYTKALCVLGQFYRIPINTEWVEENLDSGEVRSIIEKQLEISRANDFLLLSCKQTLSVVALILEATARPAPSLETLSRMPASATPGDAPLPSSSSDTPLAS